MACRLYNTERCLQHQLFNRPNFGVHFILTCHSKKSRRDFLLRLSFYLDLQKLNGPCPMQLVVPSVVATAVSMLTMS